MDYLRKQVKSNVYAEGILPKIGGKASCVRLCPGTLSELCAIGQSSSDHPLSLSIYSIPRLSLQPKD